MARVDQGGNGSPFDSRDITVAKLCGGDQRLRVFRSGTNGGAPRKQLEDFDFAGGNSISLRCRRCEPWVLATTSLIQPLWIENSCSSPWQVFHSRIIAHCMKHKPFAITYSTADYSAMLDRVVGLIEDARRASSRSVNTIMTATYWLIGRHIVEFELQGRRRAAYGQELLVRMAEDLTARFGRGYSRQNLQQMRQFYRAYPVQICQTASGKSLPGRKSQTLSGKSQTAIKSLEQLVPRFPLPWSAYVRLLTLENAHARQFYETEASRGGWTVRQLDRQINSLFYERTALSRNKAKMLTEGAGTKHGDTLTPEEEIKDPFVLEFLGLKDEYSETDIEEALIRHLEHFLLELGGDFTFIGRQRRLRIGDEWYRIDLLFFHRRLRCLVIVDLKRGKFTHADAGQMHLYLNYAREHWTLPEEHPPVGLILCSQKDEAVARYALEGLPNKVLAAEYRLALPDEKLLAAEIDKTRRRLEARRPRK